MEVEIRLWGNIGYYLTEDKGKFLLKKRLDGQKTIQELIGELRLPQELSFVVSVNGKVTDADYLLKDGDRIALFLPTAGG